jgi:predicted nucleic acid-binding protein
VNAVDTNILIWGVRKQPDPSRPDMVDRCSKLIADLQARSITIAVPSVVLAEYLMGHSSEDQKREYNIIGQSFFVPPFDVPAAAICAELYDKETFDAIRAEGVPRQCLKTDYKVIATAIAARCDRIYTDNVAQFRRIANGRILVTEVPAIGGTPALTSDDGEVPEFTGKPTHQAGLFGADEEE